MTEKARVFIDYWNFQLNWNEHADDARCDWLALPGVLLEAVSRVLRVKGLEYGGTHIYASVDPGNENLLSWLETFLNRQAGFHVAMARLIRRHRGVRCSACGTEVDQCPECGEPFTASSCKGLTTTLVCDLLSLHHEGAYDVPIVVSSDSELQPAVRHLVSRGVRVIHAGWRDSGGDLARESWASVDLEQLIPDLIRS